MGLYEAFKRDCFAQSPSLEKQCNYKCTPYFQYFHITIRKPFLTRKLLYCSPKNPPGSFNKSSNFTSQNKRRSHLLLPSESLFVLTMKTKLVPQLQWPTTNVWGVSNQKLEKIREIKIYEQYNRLPASWESLSLCHSFSDSLLLWGQNYSHTFLSGVWQRRLHPVIHVSLTHVW